MLLPQKALMLFNILLLLASITALILIIYAYVKRFLFMESEPFMGRTLLTLMVLSFTIGTAALFGVLTRKMKRSIIVINIVIATIFAIGFLGIGIGSHFIPKIVLGNQNCTNSDLKWVASGKKANSWGFLVCTLACPCQMTNYDGFSKEDNKSLDIIRPRRNSKNQVFRVQQCESYVLALLNDNYTLGLSNYFGAIQQQLKCSGWCQYTNFSYIYVFSNVNNGRPKQKACFPAIKDYVKKVVSVGGGFAYFVSVLLFLILGLNVFMVCKMRKGDELKYSLFEGDERDGYAPGR